MPYSMSNLPQEPFSLIRSAVSMQWALQAQRDVSKRFKQRAITPFLDVLDCSIKAFDLTSLDLYQKSISSLSRDKIVFHFLIDTDTYGYLLLDNKAPGNMSDLYYGGEGGVEVNEKSMSKAESMLIQDIAEVLVHVWLKVWASWITIETTEESVPKPTLQLPKEVKPLLISSFDYQMGNYIGDMLIAMPAFFVSAAVSHESKNKSFSPEELHNNIQNIVVKVRAELTRTRTTVNRLKTLQEGDILPITWPSTAYLKAGKSCLHKAKPAMQANQLILEITSEKNREF